MAICAFYHMKGGVGKTTTAVNISYLASLSDGPVLLCDFDAQGGASTLLGTRTGSVRARELIDGGKRLKRGIRWSRYPGLAVLPADFSFRNLDLKLNKKKHRKRRFEKLLKPLEKSFPLVVIDSPPGATLLSENIIRAADFLFIPVNPSPASTDSLLLILSYLERKRIGTGGIYTFYNAVDRRRKLHRHVIETTGVETPSGRIPGFHSVIPYASDIERMSVCKAPVVAGKASSAVSEAYQSLWTEMRRVVFGNRKS